MDPALHPALIATLPLWPLLGALVLALAGRRLGPRRAAAVGLLGPLAASSLTVLLWIGLTRHAPGDRTVVHVVGEWLRLGTLRIPLALMLDPLAATLALVITSVGTLIHIAAAGRAERGPGTARAFVGLNLTLAAMLLLVLAENLAVLIAGWEGVGLGAWLLIAGRRARRANAAAALKAAIVGRLGTAALLLAACLLFVASGSLSLRAPRVPATDGAAIAIAGLLLVAALARSAQLPLHGWLVDSAGAPSWAAALIQSVTTVVAGVVLVVRLEGLFAAAPVAAGAMLALGAASALLGALLALTRTDLLELLACATVSQLGLLFVAAGLGETSAATFGLLTRACAQAVLLLCAGAIVRAGGGERDLRRMGGLAVRQPLVYLAMLMGAMSLAGVPPLGGFWSLDRVLAPLLAAARHDPGPGWLLWPVYAAALTTTFLTAVYAARMIALIFLGAPAGTADGLPSSDAGGEPGLALGFVIVTLTAMTILAGALDLPAIAGPVGHVLSSWLGGPVADPDATAALASARLLNLALTLPLVGLGVVLGLFGPRRLMSGGTPVDGARWGLDPLLCGSAVAIALGVARMMLIVDQHVISPAGRLLPAGAQRLGAELRRGQKRRLVGMLLLIVFGAICVFGWLTWRIGSLGGAP